MAIEVILPRMSENIPEALIEEWLKQVGDYVSKGEVLLKIEVEKASIEIETEHSGYILEISAKVGDIVEWGSTIAVLGEETEKTK